MATSDNYELRDDQIPVFLINGFLEAGKTEFIKYTMAQEYFQAEGTTLLLMCEDGESEYDEATLEKYHTVAIRMEKETDFNEEYLSKLQAQYQPERVIIEWNGMWNQDDLYDGPMSEQELAKDQGRPANYVLSMPESWAIYQVITIMDGSTLGIYINNNNMRSFLGQMLREAELAIVNRCDNVSSEQLVDFRRKIRAMGQGAMLILEDKNGEIQQDMLPEDLPYDLDEAHIELKPEDYGIWFVDCMDNPDRYIGKDISFTAMVLKRQGSPADEFIPGRMAMTCCAADMTFLGFVAKADPAVIAPFKTRDWAKLTATVALEEREEYSGEGPVLHLKSIVRTGPIEDVVTF